MSTSVRRTYDQCRLMYTEKIKALAVKAFDRYCQNICQRLYLVGERGSHSQGKEIWTSLDVDDWDGERELVSGDYIPRNLSIEQLYNWFEDRLRRESLWIFAD